jgi:hypothetical protein
MTEAAPIIAQEPSLYCDDRELHRRIAPHLGWDKFKAALRACETKDPTFPKGKPFVAWALFPCRQDAAGRIRRAQ